MVRTLPYLINDTEIYTIYINGTFFATFADLEYGEMIARKISMALFQTLPNSGKLLIHKRRPAFAQRRPDKEN